MQELTELHDAVGAAQRPLQEITDGRLLHDLSPRVARELTEAIVAEDDGDRLHLCVADDEFPVCKKEREKRGDHIKLRRLKPTAREKVGLSRGRERRER